MSSSANFFSWLPLVVPTLDTCSWRRWASRVRTVFAGTVPLNSSTTWAMLLNRSNAASMAGPNSDSTLDVLDLAIAVFERLWTPCC